MHLRTAARPSIIIASLVCAASLLATGCASDSSSGTVQTGSSGGKAGKAQTDAAAANVAQLDRDFVIGPTAAGELNFRIAWQYPSPSASSLKGTALRGDSVYTLDQQNYLTRIRIADGKKQWRSQAADPVLDVISLNVVDDRAYLTSGSEMLVFDAVNGSQIAKWRFEKVAGTQPAEFREFLIYGARTGEVVWLSRQIGYMWRAYSIGPAVRVPPALKDNMVAAVGVTGSLVLLNATTATSVWSKHLLEPVACKPVFGEEALYVAGQDQYLWAFDLSSGRTLWKALQEAPLTSSPAVIKDRVFQQVPGYGLVCYNAMPIDSPGGEFIWRSQQATGNVILERRGELLVWDAASKRLAVLEAKSGQPKRSLDLPQVEYLFVGGDKGEDLFAISKDGRVERLVPRN